MTNTTLHQETKNLKEKLDNFKIDNYVLNKYERIVIKSMLIEMFCVENYLMNNYLNWRSYINEKISSDNLTLKDIVNVINNILYEYQSSIYYNNSNKKEQKETKEFLPTFAANEIMSNEDAKSMLEIKNTSDTQDNTLEISQDIEETIEEN